MPEKFWKPEVGKAIEAAPSLKDVFVGYGKLESERGKLRDVLTGEINAERFKGRPEKPEGYKIAAPETMKGVVILDKPPGADWKPEPGNRYAVLKADSPLMKRATAIAHKYGVPQSEFSELVGDLAGDVGQYVPTPEEAEKQTNETRAAVYSKLGEQGAQRVDHAWKALQSAIGDKAKALDAVLGSAEAVEAIEALLEKSGQAKFAPGNATAAPSKTAEELKSIIAAPDFYTNPEKQRVVAEGFQKLNPPGAEPADRALNPSRLR